MPMTKEQVISEAMTLDPHEREEIADALFASLAGATRAEIAAAWLAESNRHYEEYKRGEVTASPVDEAIERARSRVP